jgi:hypothetical protein
MISDSAWQDVLHLRSATGYISQQKALPYIASGSAANYSVEPKAHFALSIPEGEGYTRVTSPLRRAGDLIAHWQLHSALLGKKPVFSADWLTRYSRAAKARDKLRSRTRGHYETFFNMSFIQRFLEDPKRREGKPNPFLDLEGYIYRPATLGVQTKLYQGIVTIPKLGIRAVLNTVKDPGLIVGEQIALELESIRTGLIPHMAVKIRE